MFEHVVGVHVVNADEIKNAAVHQVEEKEPEHYLTATVTIAPKTASQIALVGNANNGWANLVQLDPMRKSVGILTPDGPIILCHSTTQASDSANFAVATPTPNGAYLPTGSNVSLDGTGPLWAVNPGATSIRVTVIQNRRG
jgi:hypothetical protein